MSVVGPYLLDSDVFIQAKNEHYAFSICPGFWECLIGHFQTRKRRAFDSNSTTIRARQSK
ncbi:MAG: DUF4411 family protein [Candidatus Hydrogenedentales bacterium]|jgi:hypothetical protein